MRSTVYDGSNMTPDDKAKLDYEQVMQVFTLLTDVRFKLLALVPTISGTAVALLTSADIGRAEQVVLASLGFVVTLGILFYEQRNTQLYNNAIGRLQHLEANLDLSVASGDLVGGLFASRKREPRTLFGVVPMRHDRGLALIYASVLGAWSFAALTALVRPAYAFAAGASVAVAFFLELERQNGTVDRLLALWRRREEERQLMELNRELTEQEKRGAAGREFFRKLLDERFSFIRTDGSTVDKDGFLIGLADAGNTSEVLTTQIRQVRVMGSQAFVEALVHLKGTRSGQPIEGTFRNLRLFERRDEDWCCVMWLNRRA
jgi:hypothetical protein